MKQVIKVLQTQIMMEEMAINLNKMNRDTYARMPAYKGPPAYPEHPEYLAELKKAVAILEQHTQVQSADQPQDGMPNQYYFGIIPLTQIPKITDRIYFVIGWGYSKQMLLTIAKVTREGHWYDENTHFSLGDQYKYWLECRYFGGDVCTERIARIRAMLEERLLKTCLEILEEK